MGFENIYKFSKLFPNIYLYIVVPFIRAYNIFGIVKNNSQSQIVRMSTSFRGMARERLVKVFFVYQLVVASKLWI
jgi:hypothetical protein